MHINVLIRKTKLNITEEMGEWAGVDRGVYLLLNASITPQFTYGDFDSVSQDEREFIEKNLKIAPVAPEKDETDLEIALLDLVKQGYTSVDIYGGTGGRIDHLFGNVYLLLHRDLADVKIRLIDELNHIQVLGEGYHTIDKAEGMEYVSFIPIYEGTKLTLKDLKYPLTEHELNIGSTLTISNEFNDERAVVETSRPIIMIQSKDN
jgi:thiamine pyrophosphokinase